MAGTSGMRVGTSGAGGLGGWRPYRVLIPLALFSNLVNVLSAWDEHHKVSGLPVLTEFSSALVLLCLCWLPALALARAPLRRPWLRMVLVHGAAALAFSVGHTVGMTGLRNGVAALLDMGYRFDLSIPVLIYEGRKDLVSYFIIGGVFLLFGHGRAADTGSAAAVAPVLTPIMPAQFDIRDGARLLRVAVAEILAVRSAGNYAEFLLADGRRPLMRATLTQLAGKLGACGLVRTHRSWLVNHAHVRGLTPEGSGDYAISLSDGSGAPLSRRFPDALAQLRQGPQPPALASNTLAPASTMSSTVTKPSSSP